MFAAAANALAQMFTPSFRAVLLKSVGAAVALLVLIGIALHRLLTWFVESGGTWLEASVSTSYHGTIDVAQWVIAFIASLGVMLGMVFLMPAVTALVASFFADEIAVQVERTHYPADPPGQSLPVTRSLLEGVKTALLALLVYLCAVPFLLLAGLGAVLFFFATAFLLGREYFELAAMRFHSPTEAKALRKHHASRVCLGGMLIAAFVSIPIVNLATPLFATALMVHIHKRLAESRRPEIAAMR